MKEDLSSLSSLTEPPTTALAAVDDAATQSVPPKPKAPAAGFGGRRPQSSAASLSDRGDASKGKSLKSKLQDAFAKPAYRGILEAAISVERIQKLRAR